MKQTIPDPLDRFGVTFVGLARRWRRALDESLAEVGFADAAWAPLVHLDRAGMDVSQHDLAGRAGLDDSSLVRLLDTLVERGWIERRAKPGDRRAKLVHLTDAGRAVVAEVRRILLERERAMTAGIPAEEIAVAVAVFERIAANLAEEARA